MNNVVKDAKKIIKNQKTVSDRYKIAAYIDSLEDMGLPQLKSEGLQVQLELAFKKFTAGVRDQFRLDAMKT